MPDTLAAYPFFSLAFDRDANPTDPHEAQALRAHLRSDPPAHLVVVSHGWNNDMADARALYEALFRNVRGRDHTLDLVVAGVFWPSKKMADRDLIPGGAASVGDGSEAALRQALADAEADATPEEAEHLERARVLTRVLEHEEAQDRFVDHLRTLLPDPEAGADAAPARLRDLSGHELLDLLAPDDLDDGDADMGGAAGIGNPLGKLRAAARNLLNLTTYYRMKRRAGATGKALAGVLDDLAAAAPDVPMHLVGHSFGARLVTSAAAHTEAARPASMTLLQAEFSHNAFARNYQGTRDGDFREVVTLKRVRGPIVVTHTRNDKAVGYAYPLASKLAGQAASGLGDADSLYGGLGSNGAQHTPEAQSGVMVAAGQPYPFRAGTVHNLLADAFIADHSDVTGPEVAHALVAAMQADG
ncbi:MAG: hypothetical protein AAF845_12190 [Bacteroidota bacterium]